MKPAAKSLTVFLAIIATTAGLEARADDISRPRPYLTLDAGANFLAGTTFTDQSGRTTKPKSDTGWRTGLTLGCTVDKWMAIEVESGVMRNSFQHSADYYAAVPLLANLVFRFENSTGFVPYIGAGAGIAATTVEIGDVDATEKVFAYQAKAGVAYQINPDMMISLGYKFFSTARQDYGDGALYLEHPNASCVALSFTWKW